MCVRVGECVMRDACCVHVFLPCRANHCVACEIHVL